MSVWRMQMDLSFGSKAEMLSMMNLIESMRYKLKAQDGELPIPCQVRYHECKHDEGGVCGGYVVHKFDGATDHGVTAETIIPTQVKNRITLPVEKEKEALQEQVDTLKAENTSLKTTANKTGPAV